LSLKLKCDWLPLDGTRVPCAKMCCAKSCVYILFRRGLTYTFCREEVCYALGALHQGSNDSYFLMCSPECNLICDSISSTFITGYQKPIQGLICAKSLELCQKWANSVFYYCHFWGHMHTKRSFHCSSKHPQEQKVQS
jgi:hypothetical protein